jgi:uncharacterized membrane protein YphA (DoxX/SURF4 family)
MPKTRSLGAFTAFRIAFGLVWLIDGLTKFTFLQPSDIVNMVQSAGQGQPSWLQPWFNFWLNSVTSSPTAVYYSIGMIEILLGLVLIAGFLRKPVYIVGILWSLIIWAIPEGFGGPYASGSSTDIGAAVIYAFVFVAMIIAERGAKYGDYSLDALIIRRWNKWKRLSEL